ncbi:MAG: glycosyltransferase family 9 protein [Deltaproteobacteria bacterium]|nr:glycosyltransferase family 9 protein [Deltaproteobacteria bacterium]
MSKLEKILIIKMSALGDVFMALPHVEVIVNHHRGEPIWILTSPAFESLFIHHPRVKTAVLDRCGWIGEKSTIRRLFWVRKHRFTCIYDLQGNRTSRLIVRFSGALKRVGTQPNEVYNFHPQKPYAVDTQQNVFDRLNETLAAAGLPCAVPGICRMYPSMEDVDRVEEWKRENGIETGCYAVLHAGSSSQWPSKRWPQDCFARLAVLIEATGLRCVWVGGVADEKVNRYLARQVGIDATACFNLLQLYLLGRSALFAVTNDSGPMHVMAAAGIPVYSFFGPTNWIRSHAAGQKLRVFHRDVDCSPCFRGTCPDSKGHVCLDAIDPESVFSKIQQDMNLSTA